MLEASFLVLYILFSPIPKEYLYGFSLTVQVESKHKEKLKQTQISHYSLCLTLIWKFHKVEGELLNRRRNGTTGRLRGHDCGRRIPCNATSYRRHVASPRLLVKVIYMRHATCTCMQRSNTGKQPTPKHFTHKKHHYPVYPSKVKVYDCNTILESMGIGSLQDTCAETTMFH